MYARHLVPGLVLALATAVSAGEPASRWMPPQAAMCLEIHQPQRLLDPVLDPAFLARAAALPAYAGIQSSKELRDLRGLVAYLEATMQTNWPAMVRTLARNGAALAVGGGSRHLLILDGGDPATLGRLHEIAQQIASSEAAKQGQSDRVRSAAYAGATGWTFNGKEAHAVVGNRLFAASDAEVLKAALDLLASGGSSLADREDYRAARKATGPDAVATLFVDLQQVRSGPGKLGGLGEASQNPLLALLAAGAAEPLGTAGWAALGVYVEGGALVLRSHVGGGEGVTETPAFARSGQEPGQAVACLEVPRRIAALGLYRDLAGFYAAKDELFPQRTSGLIFFENMMGIFFSGRNLTDEVLAGAKPGLGLVVARQEFDPAIGMPDPQWPAFAVVLELRDPGAFNEVLEEAWQKALGLINFTRGQQAQPGLVLDRVPHRGSTMTVAAFSAKEVPDRAHLDPRFNLRPTLALAHGHAVLSSTDQLARDVIDALGRPAPTGAGGARRGHTVLELDGAELAGVLRANRSALVQGNMLKEGHSQVQAETSIDTLCAVAGWIDRASLAAGRTADQGGNELRVTFR